jgi:hypothetical protein
LKTGFEGVNGVEGEVYCCACESSGLEWLISRDVFVCFEGQLPAGSAGMESQSMGRWTLAVMSGGVLIVENMTAKSQLEEGIIVVIASSRYFKL